MANTKVNISAAHILPEISSLQIEILSNQFIASVMVTINCGEPENFDFIDGIIQGYLLSTTINVPN